MDWSEFAYVSYALSPENVCNSVMLAESLWRLEARAETLVLVAGEKVGGDGQSSSSSARLLQQASDFYGARVKAVKVLSSSFNADIINNNNSQNEPQKPYDNTWSHSLTKLLTFNQKRYKRVLGLDSDATLLKPMDDLFLLPASAPIALPRAYWLEQKTLSTSILLATPSAKDFARIQARVREGRDVEFDMDVINALYWG